MKKDDLVSVKPTQADIDHKCLQQGEMESNHATPADGQFVDGDTLLKLLFPESSRPTLRWLRDQQKSRRIPYAKIGRLVFFDPAEVRAAWRQKFTVGRVSK